MTASTVLIQQAPFSFSRYRSSDLLCNWKSCLLCYMKDVVLHCSIFFKWNKLVRVRVRVLAYILMSRYLLFKFALPFSLARTYKRLVQPYRGFLRLCRYSKTFLRTFFTPVHTQSMPRSRDAAWIDENWTLIERHVRHLERMVFGRYLLSCHSVKLCRFHREWDIFWISVTISEICRYVSPSVAGC